MQLHTNGRRSDDDRQGRGLQQPAVDDLCAHQATGTIEQRWKSPSHKECRQEYRHTQQRPGVREQCSQVELYAAGHEKHWYEKPETKTFDLDVKLRVGAVGIWVDQTQHASA